MDMDSFYFLRNHETSKELVFSKGEVSKVEFRSSK